MAPTQISLVILLLGAAASLIVWLRADMVARARRRMSAMTKRVGLDPAPSAFAGLRNAATREVMTHRCRRCMHVRLCERWLAGKVAGDNGFCPNAHTFRTLRGAGEPG